MILYCTFTGYHHTQKLCKSQSLDFDIYRLSFSQFKCYRVRPIIRHLQPPTHLFTHCLISSNWEGFLNMSTMFLRLSTHSFTHVLHFLSDLSIVSRSFCLPFSACLAFRFLSSASSSSSCLAFTD